VRVILSIQVFVADKHRAFGWVGFDHQNRLVVAAFKGQLTGRHWSVSARSVGGGVGGE
jgi:hypothetical protein